MNADLDAWSTKALAKQREALAAAGADMGKIMEMMEAADQRAVAAEFESARLKAELEREAADLRARHAEYEQYAVAYQLQEAAAQKLAELRQR